MSDAPPPELEKKVQFVVDEAKARLDATLSAYDAISSKAVTLLSVAVPIITALGGYCIVQFDLGSPLFFAAALGGVLLTLGTVPLWKIVTGTKLAHDGRTPSDYLQVEEFRTLSLTEVQLKDCHFYEKDIADNEAKVALSARRLRTALGVFGGAALAGLTLLAVSSSVQFFSRTECRGFDRSPARFQEVVRPAF